MNTVKKNIYNYNYITEVLTHHLVKNRLLATLKEKLMMLKELLLAPSSGQTSLMSRQCRGIHATNIYSTTITTIDPTVLFKFIKDAVCRC